MAVYDKELIINGQAVRSPEQQVYKNMKDIEALQATIKPMFKTTDSTLTSASVSVATSDTNVGTATEGWLLDPNGLLFKITGNDGTTVTLQYYSDLKGPQGQDGAAVNIDDNGTAVNKCWSSDKTNSQINTEVAKAKDKGIYFTNTAPTYNSGTGLYSLDEGHFENQNSDIPIKAFDLLIYIDSNNEAKGIFKVLNKFVSAWTLDKVGDIGGGKQLYQHNIEILADSSNMKIHLSIVNDSSTQFDKTSLKSYIVDNSNGSYFATGFYKVDANTFGSIITLKFSGSTSVYLVMIAVASGSVTIENSYAITSAWSSATLTDTVINL